MQTTCETALLERKLPPDCSAASRTEARETMSEEHTLETLRGLDFLEGVAEEHLQKLAEVAKSIDFPEGEVIFREGDPALHIYLIVEGRVSLEICAPAIGCRRILTVGKGELLGWSPVLEQAQLTSTARTITATNAIELRGSQVLTLCEHNPRFGYEFMRSTVQALAKRLNATQMQLVDVFGTEMATGAERK